MDIKIYMINTGVSLDDGTLELLMQSVTPERRESLLGYKHTRSRVNSLLGEVLAKYAVRETFGIPIIKQVFERDDYGKPYLSSHPDIYFNVSHSGDLAVCAAYDKPIGIDIEKTSKPDMRLAWRVLNTDELEIIMQNREKESDFTRIWTKKEAYVKMTGLGLSWGDFRNIPTDKSKSTRYGDYHISVCTDK